MGANRCSHLDISHGNLKKLSNTGPVSMILRSSAWYVIGQATNLPWLQSSDLQLSLNSRSSLAVGIRLRKLSTTWETKVLRPMLKDLFASGRSSTRVLFYFGTSSWRKLKEKIHNPWYYGLLNWRRHTEYRDIWIRIGKNRFVVFVFRVWKTWGISLGGHK